MNKFLTALALASVLLSGAAHAADFSDRTTYTCDNDEIKDQMESNLSSNVIGIRILYAKGATEVSRSSNELRCRVTLVTNSGSAAGVMRFWNEDGHSLAKFHAGAKK
jgi:hypothetical protein